MNGTDYNWLADVLATMVFKKRITRDDVSYLVDRFEMRDERFNAEAFWLRFQRMTTMLER